MSAPRRSPFAAVLWAHPHTHTHPTHTQPNATDLAVGDRDRARRLVVVVALALVLVVFVVVLVLVVRVAAAAELAVVAVLLEPAAARAVAREVDGRGPQVGELDRAAKAKVAGELVGDAFAQRAQHVLLPGDAHLDDVRAVDRLVSKSALRDVRYLKLLVARVHRARHCLARRHRQPPRVDRAHVAARALRVHFVCLGV